MLQQTFVHVPGVGLKSEARLWHQGATSWSDYLANPKSFRIGGTNRRFFDSYVERSLEELNRASHQMFAVTLGEKFAWRAYPDFPGSTVYLDIETDGGSHGDSITMVGCYNGSEFVAFVKGDNMESFRDYISRFSVIVTFFGNGFDIPLVRRRFPGLLLDQIHIDVCPIGRLVGLRGGLKSIEHQLGLSRSPETAGLTGLHAIKLWQSYRRGNDAALDLLLAYNREDVVNLKPVAEEIYSRMRAQVFGDMATATSESRSIAV